MEDKKFRVKAEGSRMFEALWRFVVIALIILTSMYVWSLREAQPASAAMAADPLTIPACDNNSECFAFSIDTRLTATGATTGTSTNFSIPTSGTVGSNNNHSYAWVIDWGDGNIQNASGTGSINPNGISHVYVAPGEYQITIRPDGPAADGWMNAFGFMYNTSGANADDNKYKFLSIDTPLTNLMRTKGVTRRFSFMFYGAKNAKEIPGNLFDTIDTSGDTDFSYIFSNTFNNYAQNSTTATIPAGLFSSIDTSNGTDFTDMFSYTFNNYAQNSTTATIPASLFSSIDTLNGTNFTNMFSNTFYNYAQNSTTATIPAGLFDSINTSNGTVFDSMFTLTFSNYAYNSTTATIPAGLFDSINTSNGINLMQIFYSTFYGYASNSTIGTIPTGLFDSIDTSSGVLLTQMYGSTFREYAINSTVGTIPTDLFDSFVLPEGIFTGLTFSEVFTPYAKRVASFVVDGVAIDAQVFDLIYVIKNTRTGEMAYHDLWILPGDKMVPSYNDNERLIEVPLGYENYIWYRTDGTSCAVANPTADCGPQSASNLVTFPNNTEWTPDTSTEKGNVRFYNQRSDFSVTFQDPDGNIISSETINFGESAVAPTPPTRANARFIEWDGDFDNVTGDLIITAIYEEITSPSHEPSGMVPGVPNTGYEYANHLKTQIGYPTMLLWL